MNEFVEPGISIMRMRFKIVAAEFYEKNLPFLAQNSWNNLGHF